jgi:hypothetical protein
MARGSSFDAVEVATQHCDELHCIFKGVDADEGGVSLHCDVMKGTCLHSGRPFEVPPELGGRTVASRGGEARVAVYDAVGDSRNEVHDQACLGCVDSGQCVLNEVEVAAEVAADVVEERAAMDQLGGPSGMVGVLGVAIGGWWCQAYCA